jgi:hypothetical protein
MTLLLLPMGILTRTHCLKHPVKAIWSHLKMTRALTLHVPSNCGSALPQFHPTDCTTHSPFSPIQRLAYNGPHEPVKPMNFDAVVSSILSHSHIVSQSRSLQNDSVENLIKTLNGLNLQHVEYESFNIYSLINERTRNAAWMKPLSMDQEIVTPTPQPGGLSKAPVSSPTLPSLVSIGDNKKRNKIGDLSSSNIEVQDDPTRVIIKKEAIRMLQIRRTKMNKHKLRKWRVKFKHRIRLKIAENEAKEKKEEEQALAAIHGEAASFNPVEKVHRNVELAKGMGYNVTFYQNLLVNQWLEKKKKEDEAKSLRFTVKDRNRKDMKFRPWLVEKY